MDADAVNVVVLGITFRDNAVLELLVMRDHTVFVKVVAPLRQQTVGLFRRNPEVVSACGQDVLHGLTVRAKVVVQVVAFCILNLGQALVLYDLAILQPIGIIAIDAQAVFADRLELGGVSDIAGNCGELLVPTGKRVGVIRSLGLGGRAIIGRHVAICINLRRRHTVDDPGDGRAGLGDDGAGLQQLIADRAVSVAGVAVLGEGRILPTADLLRVTRSGDDLLCNNDLVADGAVLALGQTSLRARRLDSRVNDLRVTRSGDDLLCNNDLIADRAVLALGQAGLCARRLDSRVDDLRMTLGGDNRTVGELHIAVRTIGIAGITVLGASGSFHTAKRGVSVPACCGELRRIRHIAGDGSDLFVPTAECIRILRVGRAGRIGRAVGRHRAVGHRIFPQRGAVPVDPLDRVGTELLGIHSAVSDVAHDGRHLRSPAGEAVGILGIGGFGGNTAIGRHGAVVHLFGLEHSAVIVFPGHGIGIDFPTGLEGQIRVDEQRASSKIQLRSRLLRNLKRIIMRVFSDHTGDEPAVKCVALAGEAALGEYILLTGKRFYRSHRTGSAVGIKGDRPLRGLPEHCRKIDVLMRIKAPSIDSLSVIIWRPAVRKAVGIVLILGLLGGIVGKVPLGPLLAGIVALLQDGTIPVQPADMILVQCPLGVEGNVFRRSDVRPIGIGRSAAVRRRVPTGEVVVSAGESVGGQRGCCAGLHSLGGHEAIAAVGIKGNDRILRPLRVQGGVRIEIHGRSVGIGSAAAIRLRVPTGKGIVRAGKGVGGQRIVKAGVDAHGIHGARAAVGVKGDGDLVALDRPLAVGIHIGVARLGRGRRGVGTVGVVQLGGGDGDSHRCYFRTALRALVGVLFGTGDCCLNKISGTLAGIDVRTAGSRIDAACSAQHAVHIDGSVRNGTAPLTRRRICHRIDSHRISIVTGTPDIVFAPLVCIVNIQICFLLNVQLRALVDRHLYAGKQCYILRDRGHAGMDIDVYVVGDGKDILRRVNRYRIEDCHFDALQRSVSAYIKANAVRCRDVRLRKRSALCKLKHSFSTDKNNCHYLVISCNKRFLRAAIFNGQRGFNVLDIILRKREYLFHICRGYKFKCCIAAAPVSNLKALIYGRAGCNADISAAGNIAPGIERAAVCNRDLAAAAHLDQTICTRRLADMLISGCKQLSTNTDRAIDRDGCTTVQRKRPICSLVS